MPTTSSRSERAAGPPDFLGVGADIPAGAWWYAALLAHPQVRAPRNGEGDPHAFAEFCERELAESDIAAYHERFARAEGEVCGEWSGRYMSDGWVPPLLRRVAPEARLLVMLGDPVQHVRREAVRRRAAAERGGRLYLTDVVSRCGYASQLERLRRYFDRERILVLQFERCREDPAGEYRRTLRFLGIDDGFVPRALRRRSLPLPAALRRVPRPPKATGPELWPQLEDALRAALRPEAEELAAGVEGFELERWPTLSGPSAAAPRG